MKRILKLAALGLVFLLAGFVFFLVLFFRLSKPIMNDQVFVEGIKSPVQILTDKWGVPHVSAQNEEDLIFACGYLHAKDRMWQMDVMRRLGSGRLSEIFGERSLDRDRFMRHLGLKEAAQKSLAKLFPHERDLITAYCRGVNFWMESQGWNWPPEFLVLRFRPEPWRPLDSLVIKEIMSMLLCVDYPSEFLRGNLAKRLGAEKALEILEREISEVPEEVGEVSLGQLSDLFFNGGSNNWVVSGALTETGKPLLANDPHLQISVPPIWYEAHLQCPKINVTGVTIPGMPFVVIGHNENIAWGLTNSGIDVQDLYVEKLDDREKNYWSQEGWKPLLKREEVVYVRGRKEPYSLTVNWTERGPIISPEIIQSLTPVSLRWAIHDGGREFGAFFMLNKARNWDEFRTALALYNTPSQNIVYADVEGNIGYWLMGKIPIRDFQSALFPFPGWEEKGRWEGYLKEEDKISVFNPDDGIIVTANNRIFPASFPHYLSVDWDLPLRANRIRELLESSENHSLESFMEIQRDVYSTNSEVIFRVLRGIDAKEQESGEYLDMLRSWDRQMDSGKAPLLYKTFLEFFIEETLKDELGEDFHAFNFIFRRKDAGVMRILEDPQSQWYDKKDTSSVESREDIVKQSLKKAIEHLFDEYGPAKEWDWGSVHSLHFTHLLGQSTFFRFFNRGPYPVYGDDCTVNATFSKDMSTTHGPSYRQIIDLSDLRNSVCVITSGQSGHFLSRHYDDQIPLWLEGQYHPMLFYKQDIEANTCGRLFLKPKK